MRPAIPLAGALERPGKLVARPSGDGLYRLDIDLKTGRVSRVMIIKSAGSAILDRVSSGAFYRWVFTPGKWSAMIIPTTVRVTWVPVLIQGREP